MNEVLLRILSSTLNIDLKPENADFFEKDADGNFSLKDGAEAKLLELDQKRVDDWKAKNKEHFDNGVKSATSTVLGNHEKTLIEKFGFDNKDSLKGTALVGAIIAQKTSESGTGIKEEDIKKNPFYLSMESRYAKEAADAKSQAEEAIEEVKKGYQSKFYKQRAEKLAGNYFDQLKVILPRDATKAVRQRNRFVKGLINKEGFEFQFAEGSDEPLIIENGERKEKGGGHPMTLRELVEQEAGELFEFAEQNNRGNGGNNNDGAGGAGAGGGVGNYKFKDEADYMAQSQSAKNKEERAKLRAAWNASNSN